MSDLFSAVEQAYRAAVANGSYRSITVKGICEKAHVSRKAFYKQFAGRTDILRRIFDRDVVQPAIELCELLSFKRMSKLASDMQRHMFDAVHQDGAFYRDVVSAPQGGEAAFMQAAEASFRDFNLFMLEQFCYEGEPWQIEAVADYFALAKAGYLVKWIKSGYEAPVDEISNLYSTMALPFWNSLR